MVPPGSVGRPRPAVVILVELEILQQRLEVRSQTTQLLHVGLREAGQGLLALGSEDQPGDAGVVGIRSSFHQAGLLDPVDQLARAVVSQEQIVGDFTDSGSAGVLMSAHGQEQLVLRRSQPGLSGLGFAPPHETAQPGAQGQQALIVGVSQRG